MPRVTELTDDGDAKVPEIVRQPTRRGKLPAHVDPGRRFDRTALTETSHGDKVHRDYAAHFFRWGFAANFVDRETEVLEVGCGVDCPFMKVLSGSVSTVPAKYVGVDLNKLPRAPKRSWAEYREEFEFTSRHGELGEFDLIVCFEVIEHMGVDDGLRLFKAFREHLRPDGRALISTPVFNGKAAANHIHEYTVSELKSHVEAAGFRVFRRYGTFMNYNDLKRVATLEELDLVGQLNQFYSFEVLSCFLAPKYPDHSRNNVWVLSPV